MKRIICFICVLLLSSMGSMEVYAANNADTFAKNLMELSDGEQAGDTGNTGDTGDTGNTGNTGDIVSGDDGKEAVRVLIVGNSFSKTAAGVFAVDRFLKELAAGEGHNLDVQTLAYNGAWLTYYAGLNEKHFDKYKELVQLLVNNKWDYIIFQEQTTAVITHYDASTVPAVERLQQMVKIFQPQATMLLYMNAGFSNGNLVNVNGTKRLLTTAEMDLYLAAGFKRLESQLGIEAVMVGMHSHRINLLYPHINLVRTDDNKHPTQTGYYLAACCFYNRIFGSVPDPRKASFSQDCGITEDELAAVAALPADSMVMNESSIVLNQNKTKQLSVVVSSHLPQSNNVTYYSFDTNIATVNAQTGLVKAISPGSTTVYAETPDGLQAFCNVVVRQPLSFTREYYVAGKGDTITVNPQTNQTNLKWSSGNRAIATVNTTTGAVTAKKAGKAVITVTNADDASDTASYTLYVSCDAPKNIKTASAGNPAANAKYGNVKVSWSAVDTATSYDIYRCTSKNGDYQLIGTSNTLSYKDKTAAVNKCYYYKVTANNAYQYCTSVLSDSSRGIIPKAPTLKVKRSKNGNANLSWKKNAKATGYIIYRSAKKNSGYKRIAKITAKATTSYVDKSAKTKNCYYRIKAYRTMDKKVFYGVKSQTVKL